MWLQQSGFGKEHSDICFLNGKAYIKLELFLQTGHTIEGRALHLGLKALKTITNKAGACLFVCFHMYLVPSQGLSMSCGFFSSSKTQNLVSHSMKQKPYCTILSANKWEENWELPFVDSSNIRYLANDGNNDGNY